jgi:ATP-dependent RNA helicase RhlE
VTFASLGLAEPILAGVRAAGYEHPTDIQEKVIPLALGGCDLIGLGQTGSGKTAAFGLPLLHEALSGPRGLRALILVPTRELCVQVAEQLRIYASATDLAVCTAFGGIDIGIQEAAFKRGLDVLVACPGRLLDHLERRNLTLESVGTVVLDEADRMLDMGFLPQIRSIMVRCPQERRTWLFSATMPPEVDELCRAFLPDARRVQVGKRSQSPSTITHRFVGVRAADKERYLRALLERQEGRVLVFVKTKIKAEQLGRKLERAGLPVDSIHGDKTAEARHVVLRSFERGRMRFLVATDVAARGIDVDDIAMVVNFDMPNEVEDYVHRVGRTGRAGATGAAISLVSPTERAIHRAVIAHLNGTARAAAGGAASNGNGADAAPARDAGRRRRRRKASARGGRAGVMAHGGQRR